MKFLTDECCDVALVAGLRDDGHDVLDISESQPGVDDRTVLDLAADDGRLLVTEDKDFGELVIRLGLPAHGIILLRLDPADVAAKLRRLREVLAAHPERLAGSFTVIDRDKVRFRPLRPGP